jgi:hypothetical protein
MADERRRLARIKTVLTWTSDDAFALAWQRLAALYQRRPWLVRFMLIVVATPVVVLMWFMGWKILALSYAAVVVGTVVTIGEALGRVEESSRE